VYMGSPSFRFAPITVVDALMLSPVSISTQPSLISSVPFLKCCMPCMVTFVPDTPVISIFTHSV